MLAQKVETRTQNANAQVAKGGRSEMGSLHHQSSGKAFKCAASTLFGGSEQIRKI